MAFNFAESPPVKCTRGNVLIFPEDEVVFFCWEACLAISLIHYLFYNTHLFLDYHIVLRNGFGNIAKALELV
jgi:hypothetical protein